MLRKSSYLRSGETLSTSGELFWNGNITQITEVIPGTLNAVSTFEWDYENRLLEAVPGGAGMTMEFTWDGFNRAVKSRATIGMNVQDFEHIFSGSRYIGSKEVTDPQNPVTGKVWQWGVGYGNHGKNELIEAAQISSASARNYYMVNDEKNTGRLSYINNAVTAGDTVDAARMCSETLQVNGSITPARVAIATTKSELFSAYAFTLDADRAVFAYGGEGTLALLAADLEFEGSRVKSPVTGRDFNPMGRGDGTYYAQGAFAIYEAKSEFVGEITTGFGNSVCNGEAVPTALDLGGSPVHGANTNGAGECCGGFLPWLIEKIENICNYAAYELCVAPFAAAYYVAYGMAFAAFEGAMAWIHTLFASAIHSTYEQQLGGTLVWGAHALPASIWGGIQYGGSEYICHIVWRDNPEELRRCLEEVEKNKRKWMDSLTSDMETFMSIRSELRAWLYCEWNNALALAFYQWQVMHHRIKEAYRLARNVCAAMHCRRRWSGPETNPPPVYPYHELIDCKAPWTDDPHYINKWWESAIGIITPHIPLVQQQCNTPV